MTYNRDQEQMLILATSHDSHRFYPRDEIMEKLVDELSGDHETDLNLMIRSRLKDTSFADIFSPEFQIFRQGRVGLGIEIPNHLQQKYILDEISIDTLGPHHDSHLDETDLKAAMDFYTGMNLTRAFIASYFVEVAKHQGRELPSILSSELDIPVLPRNLLTQASAPQEGVVVYDADSILQRWQRNHGALFNETTTLHEKVGKDFTTHLLRIYRHLPQEVLEWAERELYKTWLHELLLTGAQAYNWFQSDKPPLLTLPLAPITSPLIDNNS